jgi:hypothetical protein
MMTRDAVTERYSRYVGHAFGQLTLRSIADKRGDRNRILGEFVCACGRVVTLPIGRVAAGKREHCGCKTNRATNLKHGMRDSPDESGQIPESRWQL